ncbi:MAG: carbamoyltransferase [Gemmataceae bacterium]
MTAILGISAWYHDSAAALVVDGRIIAAAQEERFSRIKHDPNLPTRAIEYCLREGNLEVGELEYVVFYEKPLTKFERLLETYLSYAPQGFLSFCRAVPLWLKDKLFTRRLIQKSLGAKTRIPIVFLEHHESHAASAFFPSPFRQAAILTLDGVGEWSTATFGVGQENRITLTHQLSFPHSLGLLYSAFTYYCGFEVNGGEYKLMGLAPYGKPTYVEVIRKHLVDMKPDGSFRLNMTYFNYCQGFTMTNHRFAKLFGGRPRRPESEITQRHMDLAASIQAVTEEIVLRMGQTIHQQTGMSNLVMAGGVALNCVANGRLLREGPFDAIWIQPAAGDAGGALGAALFVWHQLLGKPRERNASDFQHGSLLGPSFCQEEIRRLLDQKHVRYQYVPDFSSLVKVVSDFLQGGKVVGWFQGRMEFGPRALGNRSILADPRGEDVQNRINQKVKFRESFRPFAPAVLAEYVHEWFDFPTGQESPYMLFVASVLEQHRRAAADVNIGVDLLNPLSQWAPPRSTVPAITHVDYTARLQTVDETRNPKFYQLVSAFYKRTGCPILVNTSFNVRGEPIVCTPEDALRCYQTTGLDVLVLEDFVIEKEVNS